MEKIVLRLFGVAATAFFGDTAVFDRWRWLCRNLMCGTQRTLDAGCGSGALTLYAARQGNDAVGISLDERNNGVARRRAKTLGIRNARFITGDLRKLDSMARELGVFDQIICFETIEHIMDDGKLVRDLVALLRPKGRIFLTAPYKYYDRIMGSAISEVENGDHVRWGYTHEEITSLFARHGLVVTAKDYLTGIISQRLILWYRFLSGRIPYHVAWVLLFPLRVFVVFDPFVTKLLRYPHLSVAVIAEKREKF